MNHTQQPGASGDPRDHLRREVRLWLLALLLLLPAVLPYAAHYLAGGDRVGTGFIQGDQPNYMAVAREYFDDGGVHLLYGNPFTGDGDAPRIYFQPSTFVLGLVQRITGLDPGIVFNLFGLLSALAMARVMIGLYGRYVAPGGGTGLLLFFWGGGVLVLAGLAITAFYALYGGVFSWRSVFQLDPFSGWWMLNLGRNFVLPLEALYHLLFLGAILLVVGKRFGPALGVVLLLSASHPYTGSELLAILFVWSFVEILLGRRSAIPPWFFAGISLLLLLHIAYYLYFLPQFPDHRALMAFWDQPWFLRPESMIAAYGLVGGAAIWRLRSVSRLRAFAGEGQNRLLIVWFLVAFLLANHQWFMHPVEPLHFTRGYLWSALFLIGAPGLIDGIDRLLHRGTVLARAGIVLVVLVFLSDNGLWLGAHTAHTLSGDVWLTHVQMRVLRWVDARGLEGAVLVSEDPEIARMAAVYTPVRPWSAGTGITPKESRLAKDQEEFFSTGRPLPEWGRRPLVVVFVDGRHSPDEIARSVASCSAGRSMIERLVTGGYTVIVLR